MSRIRKGAGRLAMGAMLAGTSFLAAGSSANNLSECSSVPAAAYTMPGTVSRAPLQVNLQPWGLAQVHLISPRAQDAWNALQKNFSIPACSGFFSDQSGGKNPGAIWPQSQVIAAALDMAQLTGDFAPAAQMLANLSQYQHPSQYSSNGKQGYSPSTSPEADIRYYDDNSWIGLDFMQAYTQTQNSYYLYQAEKLFQFVKTGQHPQGGMLWREGDPSNSFNMPATGSSTEFALQLYQATGNQEYLKFAQKNLAFMDAHLLIKKGPHKGLYVDGATWSPGGKWTQSQNLWSYNQGIAIGSHRLMGEILKNEGRPAQAKPFLQQAQQTTSAAVAYFQGETLWKQPAAFNAILYRNLPPKYRQAFRGYLNRAWNEARDPRSGLFYRGGIGLYGSRNANGDSLDQAAFVQMFALNAQR